MRRGVRGVQVSLHMLPPQCPHADSTGAMIEPWAIKWWQWICRTFWSVPFRTLGHAARGDAMLNGTSCGATKATRSAAADGRTKHVQNNAIVLGRVRAAAATAAPVTAAAFTAAGRAL